MKKKEKQQEPRIIQAEKPAKKSHKKRNIIIGVVVVLGLIALVPTEQDNAAQSDKSVTSSVSALQQKPEPEPAPESEPQPESAPEPEPTPEPTPQPEPAPATTPSLTLGQKNALATAKSYLNSGAFSYSGLIDQLEYEGYSIEDATYAADNCGADWNEQAGKSAKEYMDYDSFSRSGLIDQLIYEGFTQEQAEYGVTQVGY